MKNLLYLVRTAMVKWMKIARLWQSASCSVKMMSQCLKYTISPLQSINLQKIMLWQIRSHPGPQQSDWTTKRLQVGMHLSKVGRVPNQRLGPLKGECFRHSSLTETKMREHSLPRFKESEKFNLKLASKKVKIAGQVLWYLNPQGLDIRRQIVPKANYEDIHI